MISQSQKTIVETGLTLPRKSRVRSPGFRSFGVSSFDIVSYLVFSSLRYASQPGRPDFFLAQGKKTLAFVMGRVYSALSYGPGNFRFFLSLRISGPFFINKSDIETGHIVDRPPKAEYTAD
jgi:hypothetical protein